MALVAEWRLDGSGEDASGNGFHLTGSPQQYFNGEFALFDGTSRPMSHPNDAAFNVQTFSIRARVLPLETSQNGFIFEKGTVNTQYSLFFQNTNTMIFRTHHGAAYDDLSINLVSLGFTRTFPAAPFYDVVATYDGAHKRLFFDAQEVASKAYAATISSNTTGVMIGQYNTNSYFYNGGMADVQFYDHALSPAEIADLHQNARAIEVVMPPMLISPLVRLTRQRQLMQRRYPTIEPVLAALPTARVRAPWHRIHGQVLNKNEVPSRRPVYALREDGPEAVLVYSQPGNGMYDLPNLPPVPHTLVAINEPNRNGIVHAHVQPVPWVPEVADPDAGIDYGLSNGGDDNEGGEGGEGDEG